MLFSQLPDADGNLILAGERHAIARKVISVITPVTTFD
jgi:hypothetical protein